MLSFLLPPFLPLLFLSCKHFGRAVLVNFTIDDTIPDSNHEAVIYDPPKAWNSNTFCLHVPCFAKPDVNRLQSGTWHECSFHAGLSTANEFPNQPLSATANFHGNAVYVYAVLPPADGKLASTADITIYINGTLAGHSGYDSGPDYVYGFPVYANPSLPLGSHNIRIVNGVQDGSDSLFILDRIVYSTVVNDPQIPPSTSSSSTQPVGPGDVSTTGLLDPSSTPSTLSSTPSTPFLNQTTSSSEGSTSRLSTTPGTSVTNATTTITATVPPPSTSPDSGNAHPHRSLSTGAIVGITLGSLAGIIAIIFTALYCRRHRAKRDRLSLSPGPDIYGGDLRSHPTPRFLAGWLIASDSKRDVVAARPQVRVESSPPPYQF